MQHSEVRVGQAVNVEGARYPGVWTVLKVLPTNIRLEQAGRILSCHPAYMTPASGAAAVTVELSPWVRSQVFYAGMLVRLDGKPGLFVVLVDKVDKVNVARLGGDNNRYYRALPRHLTVVDPATVAALEELAV